MLLRHFDHSHHRWQYFWKTCSEVADTITELRAELRLALWTFSLGGNEHSSLVGLALFRSSLYGFYANLTTYFPLALTTIPIGLKNSLNDAFYNYHSVYSAVTEESKKLQNGLAYSYERLNDVWFKVVLKAFLAAFEARAEWTAVDWGLMELIFALVFDMRISRRTLLDGISDPKELDDQEVNDAAGCSDSFVESLKMHLQTVFKGGVPWGMEP